MSVEYPEGVQKPAMRSYNVKPFVPRRYYHPFPRQIKRHSKYNSQKIYAFHTWFDSKSEVRFCCLLLSKHANFAYHHKYILHPHERYQYRGYTINIRQRSYTTDFIIWNKGQKHNWLHPKMIVDIKGKKQVTVSANRQMDDFSREYHIPVIIARYNYQDSKQTGLLIFDMHIRGTSKKNDFQETCAPIIMAKILMQDKLNKNG